MSHQKIGAAPIVIDIADAFTMLASPARVLILGRLCRGPCAVADPAEAAGLTPSATSHQLRMQRHMRWVARERHGRQMIYTLHDDHVSDLLAQALFHLDHVRTDQRAAVSDLSALHVAR